MQKGCFLILIAALLFVSGHSGYAMTNEEASTSIFSSLDLPQPYLVYIKIDEQMGWYARNIGSKSEFEHILTQDKEFSGGWIIPVFPTVSSPGDGFEGCKPYYDYILQKSGIKKHDKVLVIGPGTGSDVWVAWLKSQDTVFAVDINPLAVANTKAVAQIGGFPADVIQGDIRTMVWPDRFKDFDFVLWLMPFWADVPNCGYETSKFNTCDNGNLLKEFLLLIPKLLKKDGKAIFLNSPRAAEVVHFRSQEMFQENGSVVFVVTNK